MPLRVQTERNSDGTIRGNDHSVFSTIKLSKAKASLDYSEESLSSQSFRIIQVEVGSKKPAPSKRKQALISAIGYPSLSPRELFAERATQTLENSPRISKKTLLPTNPYLDQESGFAPAVK
jgi:hypothetical protein